MKIKEIVELPDNLWKVIFEKEFFHYTMKKFVYQTFEQRKFIDYILNLDTKIIFNILYHHYIMCEHKAKRK